MGKNKGGNKKKSVFKVAGAKSLKAKSKAKPYSGNLKKIKETLRNNVNKINKDLVALEKDIRFKKEKNMKEVKNSQSKVKQSAKSYSDLEVEKQETLQKLSKMQF